MYLGKADINTYDKGAGREFLVTNGRGSYGFSSVIGANTRREHGLLVARPLDGGDHRVLLSKYEETLYAGGKKYQLATNRYKDLIYPDGFRYLQEFQYSPLPTFLFVIHSTLLRKTVFMPEGSPCTIVKYELLATPERIRLELRPLMAHRSSGDLGGGAAGEGKPFEGLLDGSGNLSIRGRGMRSRITLSSGEWHLKPLWFDNLVYEKDERSGASLDRLWSPGCAVAELGEGDMLYVIASEGDTLAPSLDQLPRIEREAIERIRLMTREARIPKTSGVIKDMIASASHLIDSGSDAPAILSGFPSGKVRARDAFVALPGLLLATGRAALAEPLLRRWIDAAKECGDQVPDQLGGLVPPLCESADGGLWLLYAMNKTATQAGSYDAFLPRWDQLKAIVDRYAAGIESLSLFCEESGLLHLDTHAPERHWMDGTISGEPVVNRRGSLVEVNALWYNGLRTMEEMAEAAGDRETRSRYGALAEKVKDAFCRTLWNAEGNYLFDWVDTRSGKRDGAIRPNQILAASLPFSPLPPEQGRAVVDVCWNELYSTYGLRSLDPHHDKFKGRYEGREDQKIKARLRGMAWPWLLGHFITAYLRFNPNRRDIAWMFLRPFTSHFRHGYLGGVAEFFDGTMPYAPHGDVLSSASMGELLRVLHEDLLEPES
jgi:predicted glycogen debranching enzyme